MAQYNWYANTKTYMIRADYDFDKAGIAKGLTGLIRYAVQDFDDNKDLVQADSSVIHFDIAKELSSDMYIKLRVGLVDAKKIHLILMVILNLMYHTMNTDLN